MNRHDEVEYCNLELIFNRRLIQQMITRFIEEGYSLYWNEKESWFIISIRSGRRIVKLKFERTADEYKLVGNYSIRDRKLSDLLEGMIGDAKGHAVVKRFKDEQILIQNIMYGEIIKTVEISGVERKVVFQKTPSFSPEQMIASFKSRRVEERIPVLQEELDNELGKLYLLLQNGGTPGEIAHCKQKLQHLRYEYISCEV